ncbi:GNAT family N-acetyltransferase [Streptomyces sp. NPDC057654]|uniref:GNAT family N-acetyltransferase n=1 Tax=Streptomyces sp. NPDC057654 TaxID=3346196 RepID=UPI00368C9D24
MGHRGCPGGRVRRLLRCQRAPAEHAAPQAFVGGLFVAPDHRRQEAGRLLLQQFAAEARGEGCTFLTLIPDGGDGLGDRVQFFRQCGLVSLTPHDPDAAFGAPLTSFLDT